jgi:hypothetical protein
MHWLRLRAFGVASVGVVVVAGALAAGVAAADTPGLLDVTKQVAKIQQQVDALVAKGQATRTGALSLRAVCGDSGSTRVFSAWGDPSEYSLVPSGGLESEAGWSLNDKSRLVADNAPYSAGSRALFLGAGGEAASPSVCVSTRHPSIRFFAKNNGSPDSTLKVTVLYEATDGKVRELHVARLVGVSTWQPTPIIPFYVNLIAAASPAGVTAVAFELKAEGKGGSWTIDELYVDPVKTW